MDVQSTKKVKFTGEDRLSALPEELLHQILKSIDTKSAVQTSVLSKRWKFVWTTLPFLKFLWNHQTNYDTGINKTNAKFTRHVLNNRNHRSSISSLKLRFITPGLFDRLVKYAIARNVEYLNVHFRFKHKPYGLWNYSSNSIKKLKVRMNFQDIQSESECWDLPALTTLYLRGLFMYYEPQTLPEMCITCLPALTNLCLEDWDLTRLVSALSSDYYSEEEERPLSFNWPALTSLCLIKCILPEKVWNFPVLKSLELHDVTFPANMNEIFTALVSLQNLKLSFNKVSQKDFFIPCPELVNLEIRTCYKNRFYEVIKRNFVVLAPKLRNFTSVGIFTVKFEVPELDNVNMKLRGWIDHQDYSPNQLKEYYRPFKQMLLGLGGAKILNLELETIKALSSISDFLASSPSPFYNLQYVKLPHGCQKAIISRNLRSYLLGASPTATIITTFSQRNTNPHKTTASVTSQNVLVQKLLAASKKALLDSGNVPKTVCIDTVDTGVQEEHVLQNSVQDADSDRVRHVGSPVALLDSGNVPKTVCINTVDTGVPEEHVLQNSVQHADSDRVRHVGSPVEGSQGTDNDHASSSSGNIDHGLWRGYAVNSEFVSLLNAIMDKYPQTFENFTTKNKRFSTMKLDMLCKSVHDFAKISMTEVDTEMIAGYRDVFADLQKLGFDVSWLVSRLDFVEQLGISHPLLPELHAIDCDIDGAKSKLQDLQINMDETKSKLQNLQNLRDKKVQEIRKLFGTMGANLAAGYIGDDLLPVL